jgi:hypothetical protein
MQVAKQPVYKTGTDHICCVRTAYLSARFYRSNTVGGLVEAIGQAYDAPIPDLPLDLQSNGKPTKQASLIFDSPLSGRKQF